jgi:hypothetical protein
MPVMEKHPIPPNTLLNQYSINGAYVDCYSTEIIARVSLPEFIIAFYTTSLFKLERFILKLTVSRPSTDEEARKLANGEIEKFAAWHLENRTENEILMCDFVKRTRSWLMVVPTNIDGDIRTRLYFGSAVVPIQISKTGEPSIGVGFQALLGFHKIYSRLLLYFAKSRLRSQYLFQKYRKESR